MNAASDLENSELAKGHDPRTLETTKESIESSSETQLGEYEVPTEEELHTLRRISGQIPWTAYTVAFVELCERFSYYGTTAVCKYQSCFWLPAIAYTLDSRQLYPTGYASRVKHGCRIRAPIWCPWDGTTCIDWPYHLVCNQDLLKKISG
jgi:hypothetical protein